jgi:hypothetical protein
MLPFYPSGWAAAIGLAAALLAFRAPRWALAVALAAPVFPLGNLALGLALLYGAVAVAWLALAWRDPRAGLLFAAGPLLAPLAALALVPLLAQAAARPYRRAAHALAAVAAAAIAAGARGADVPLLGTAFGPARLAELESPVEAARRLWASLPPELALLALALAATAAAIPPARARGLWGIAGLGAGMLAATLLLAPSAPALPLVAAAWVTCIGLGLRAAH